MLINNRSTIKVATSTQHVPRDTASGQPIPEPPLGRPYSKTCISTHWSGEDRHWRFTNCRKKADEAILAQNVGLHQCSTVTETARSSRQVEATMRIQSQLQDRHLKSNINLTLTQNTNQTICREPIEIERSKATIPRRSWGVPHETSIETTKKTY